MKALKEKLEKIKNVGKVEKIKLYYEIIELSYHEKSEKIFEYFAEMLLLFKEYLIFDPTPPESLKSQFASSLKYLFLWMRKSSDFEHFEHYLSIFNTYSHLIEDKAAIAKIFQICGYYNWLKNDIDKSFSYLEDSLRIINETSIVNEIPERYTNLGYLYEYVGNYKKADEFYRQGLTFAQINNYDEALILAYAGLGRINLRLKKFQLAISYLEENLKLIGDNENDPDVATITTNIAMAYMNLNQPEKALELNLQFDKEWVQKSDSELYYTIICNIGSSYYALKNYKNAKIYFKKALDYALEANDVPLKICSKINLAYIAMNIGEFNNALEYLQKTLLLIDDSSNIRQNMEIYHLISKVYFEKKEYEKALENSIIAENLAKQIKDYKTLSEIKHLIALCYNKLKNYQVAFKHLLQSQKLEEKNRQKNEAKDNELENRKIIDSGTKSQYIYFDSFSFISRELNHSIGAHIIGKSKEIQRVIEEAFIAAKNQNINVMIYGESGTGKELIAKLIHFASGRAKHPFVEINSSVFTTSLAESSLFGHKKGAFTGASESYIGYFESAHKGTLFLDEISEMPKEIQSMMLRVIETKKIKPLGSNSPVKVDFRLICASNHDIKKLSAEQKFRFDLFNRINTLEIQIPPLRERKDDIPFLINYYLNNISEEMKITPPNISKEALEKLYDYHYPGNIRELKNIIQRLLLFQSEEMIKTDDLFLPSEIDNPQVNDYTDLDLENNEKKLIQIAMQKTGDVNVNAAKLLGISPYALARRLKKYQWNGGE